MSFFFMITCHCCIDTTESDKRVSTFDNKLFISINTRKKNILIFNMPSNTLSFLLSNNFQWLWKSNNVDAESTENDQWERYTDIDNDIIEHAFHRNQSNVELDEERTIDLHNMLQHSQGKSYPIKRTILAQRRRIEPLKQERFNATIPLDIPTKNPPNVLSMMRHFSHISNIYRYSLGFNRNKPVLDILKESIEGIMKEGTIHNKEHSAKQLVEYLECIQEYAEDLVPYEIIPAEIGDMLAHMFTKDSFWYKLINQITRNLKTMESDKVQTIGPFCYLLNEYLKWNIKTPDCPIVYRGIDLTDEERLNFMKSDIQFLSFTSTSKKRQVADIYGNTLLVIELRQPTTRCGSDISQISNFPEEEEFLILPGSVFDFIKYEYDQLNSKHIHYLKESWRNADAGC